MDSPGFRSLTWLLSGMSAAAIAQAEEAWSVNLLYPSFETHMIN